MKGFLAERMQNLGTETAFEVLAKAKALEAQGRHIIHLEIGEPDFATPANIVERAVEALRRGETHYTPAPGIPAFRETIARYISRTRGIEVSPDQVVVTPGGKPIMFYVIMALVDPGDEVIYPNPGFPIYESMIRFTGGVPVPLPLREDKDFAFDVAELERLVSPRTKLVILNSPQNPTGGVIPAEDIRRVAAFLRDRNVAVLSDEIYSRIAYDCQPCSIAAEPGMAEKTVILDGFSKTYAMTGWRLGFGVMPVELARQVTKLMINSNSCTAAFTQIAGIEALEGPQESVDSMVEEFRKRRDLLVDGLNSIDGITCRSGGGAFYVFPNISALGLTSSEAEAYFLNEASVAVLSGTSFGKYGEGYIRISYANSAENLRIALERIEEAVDNLKRGKWESRKIAGAGE